MPAATELSEIVALRIEGKKQHAKRSIFSACMLLIGNHILPLSGKMVRILVGAGMCKPAYSVNSTKD